METREHIGRDTAIRHYAPYRSYAVEIPLARITAVHRLQHLVAAALHRQMYMIAHIRIAGYNMQHIICHILGMRSSETHTHVRSRLRHTRQQVGKRHLLTRRLITVQIAIDILTQQRYLTIPLARRSATSANMLSTSRLRSRPRV